MCKREENETFICIDQYIILLINMNISKAIKLKKRGYSLQEIADKAFVSRQAVSQALQRAKAEGLWNGESGYLKEELKSETIKTRITMLRCQKRKCRSPLLPLDLVWFIGGTDTDHLKQQLISKGYNFICPKCKTAYDRPMNVPIPKASCPKCNLELKPVMCEKVFLGYCCFECEIVYVYGKNKKLEKAMRAQEEVE